MDELKGELTGHLHRLIESDRASGDRALDYHRKLGHLVDKLSIILKRQHQQLKVDQAYVSMSEAFREFLLP